jgi:transposase InsO family protein
MPSKEGRDAVLLAQIRQVERDNDGNLGVKRVHEELNANSKIRVSRRRVQRVMHENGIKARRCILFKPQTTKADPNEAAYPNLLDQDFAVEKRGQVWLADITYIRAGEKWAYLAVVLDLFDRKPIGWALGRNPSSELACMALRRALQRRKPAKGLIHHSDRGCQYTSHAYRKLLDQHKIAGSMSRKGNPYDRECLELRVNGISIKNPDHNNTAFPIREDSATQRCDPSARSRFAGDGRLIKPVRFVCLLENQSGKPRGTGGRAPAIRMPVDPRIYPRRKLSAALL